MEKQVERLVPAPDRLARHFSEEIPTEPLSHQAFSLISTVAAAETLRDFAPNGRDLIITYFRISKRWDRFLVNLLGETLVQ